MSGPTAAASNISTTTSSATSPSRTKASNYAPNQDLTLTVYTPEPDSPTAHALTLLASWTAANDRDAAAQAN